jgi:hypothetical protein
VDHPVHRFWCAFGQERKEKGAGNLYSLLKFSPFSALSRLHRGARHAHHIHARPELRPPVAAPVAITISCGKVFLDPHGPIPYGRRPKKEVLITEFYDNLVKKARMKEWFASAFLAAVRIGGDEVFGLSFSWAFAHKKQGR